jgi:hypothetical protein
VSLVLLATTVLVEVAAGSFEREADTLAGWARKTVTGHVDV